MPRRTPLVALLLSGALLAGCTADAGRPVAAPSADAMPSAPVSQSPSDLPSELPSELESPSASPSPSKKPAPKPTYDVVAVQKQLTSLGYYIAAIDGRPGAAQRSSVMAFQKVQGIKATGAVDAATLAALKAPKRPVLKGTAPADRVEVDLTKQVLYIVKKGAVSRILPVSSGNGKAYLQKNGGKARALTPVGYYKVERRIVGVREADLGTLYDPQYFYRGWAIHGSNSVPARPASHGCIRVTRADATWLLGQINVGSSVYIYGGTHTFAAGSSAPGTDNPTGDTDADSSPSASPEPEPSPTSASPSPSASAVPPLPTGSASPSPSRTTSPSPSRTTSPNASAAPSATPSSAAPTPSPTRS